MARRKGYNSDTESGEEKEIGIDDIFPDEAEREKFYQLPELDRERIMNEFFEKKLNEKQRKMILQGFEPDYKDIKKQPASPDSLSSDDAKPTRRKRKRSDDDYEAPTRLKKKTHIEREKTEAIKFDFSKEKGELTLEDIERIRINRDQLVKWIPHSDFDRTVRGAFVRVNIGTNSAVGPVYLMCEISDIIPASDYYQIDPKSNVKTNKLLVLAHGKCRKNLKMSIVSNTPFIPDEFEKYLDRLKKDSIKTATHLHIETKAKDIQNAMNHKYTNDEIEGIIQRQLEDNLKKGKIDLSAVRELDRLKLQRDEAKGLWEESTEDKYREIYNKLEEKIKKLEYALDGDNTVIGNEIVQMVNERNRSRQLEWDSKKAEEIRKANALLIQAGNMQEIENAASKI